jgi:L-asparagine transporter-like permease
MFKKYLIRLLIFVAIITLIASGLYFTVLSKFYLPVFPYVLLFFAIISALTHYILIKSGKSRIAKFSTSFMGITSLKLFLYLIFIIVYLLIDKTNALVFVLTFFIIYLLFTIFETSLLIKDLDKK